MTGTGSAAGVEGYKIGGFDAAVTSTVRGGSGLSSSAAFEVMLCAIFDELYNHGTLEYKHRAKISQFAENMYFGKPSGLLDQMASSTGGLVPIQNLSDNGTENDVCQDLWVCPIHLQQDAE